VCPRAPGKSRDKTRALSSRETILYNVNCEFIKKKHDHNNNNNNNNNNNKHYI